MSQEHDDDIQRTSRPEVFGRVDRLGTVVEDDNSLSGSPVDEPRHPNALYPRVFTPPAKREPNS